MNSTTYAAAVNSALDRLQTTGFYLDNFFANHGPMAAEALAGLGYCDEVDGWVDANIHHRKHGALPNRSDPINGKVRKDWQEALGDRKRGGDWVDLFRRGLAETDWRHLLETWWPRLLPGCAGSLTHGLIRTAHAVRSLRTVDAQSALQIDELARGLAFWATEYSRSPSVAIDAPTQLSSAAVDRALSELTAEYAGYYAATMPSRPVPLIHTVTAPAAMRLVLTELPAYLHGISFQTMVSVNRGLFAAFGGRRLTIREPAESVSEQELGALAAQAVDIGDEHAIKMCEAAIREHRLRPDPRYLSAASTALTLIRNR
jgi:hypothetical protein